MARGRHGRCTGEAKRFFSFFQLHFVCGQGSTAWYPEPGYSAHGSLTSHSSPPWELRAQHPRQPSKAASPSSLPLVLNLPLERFGAVLRPGIPSGLTGVHIFRQPLSLFRQVKTMRV